ncbi:hypothetical protein LCGC14_2321470, partial [marine sediment metagenome]
VGAFGGLFLATCYRSLTWQRLKEAVYLTAKTSAMVCWLFVGSWTFASVFSYLGGEHLISEFVQGMDLTPLQFLLLAQLIIFLLGFASGLPLLLTISTLSIWLTEAGVTLTAICLSRWWRCWRL